MQATDFAHNNSWPPPLRRAVWSGYSCIRLTEAASASRHQGHLILQRRVLELEGGLEAVAPPAARLILQRGVKVHVCALLPVVPGLPPRLGLLVPLQGRGKGAGTVREQVCGRI